MNEGWSSQKKNHPPKNPLSVVIGIVSLTRILYTHYRIARHTLHAIEVDP